MSLAVHTRRAACALSLLLPAACSGGPGVETRPRPANGGTPPAEVGGGAGAPVPLSSGAVVYRPATTALAFARRDSLTLQLPGGATQVQEFRRTAFLDVSVRGAAAPYEVTIRLDSLRQEGGLISPDSLFRAEGTRWTGALGANGELTDLQADRASQIGDQVGATLHVLFPALPLSGLEQGSTWSDTTERKLKADAFDATERAVTSYKATAADSRAITIESRTTFERTGTGGQAAQPMEMKAGGSRHGVYRFGKSGTVMTAEGADSAEITISVPAVGQTVPVSQRATWRIDNLQPARP
jgi:hypothetical protein